MPQANSTTSSPRCTSPRASDSTLPCSSVIASASSGARRLTISRNAKSTLVRRLIEVCDQAGNASRAAAIADSTSTASARSTSACCCPVAGLYTGAARSETPVAGLPAIQCSIVLIGPSCTHSGASAKSGVAPRDRGVQDRREQRPRGVRRPGVVEGRIDLLEPTGDEHRLPSEYAAPGGRQPGSAYSPEQHGPAGVEGQVERDRATQPVCFVGATLLLE